MKRLFILLLLSLFSTLAYSQDTRSDDHTYSRCIDGWRAFDGAVNSHRESLCDRLGFASCMRSYMDMDGAMGQNRINTCMGIAPRRPQGNDDYALCRHAWMVFDGALSPNRELLCRRPGFAYCMAFYIKMDGAMSEARTNLCMEY